MELTNPKGLGISIIVNKGIPKLAKIGKPDFLINFDLVEKSISQKVKENLTFPKEEKLKSRKMIGKIFSDGTAVKSYPIRIQFIFHDFEGFPSCQIGASVPKRNFKKAVDRNRIKRQIKEAYRLNKNSFIQKLEAADKKIAMMIIYSGKEKFDYDKIESSTIKAIQKIIF